MTANNCWIPFSQDLIGGKLNKCLDFTNISIPHPFGISFVIGEFKKLKFEFTDTTLRSFVYDLNNWTNGKSITEKEEMKNTQLRFLISQDMLKKVHVEAIQNLIDKLPHEYFIFDVKDAPESMKGTNILTFFEQEFDDLEL
jgi:hypothetical protein